MLVSELDTPVLVIDLDIMEENIRRLEAELSALGMRSRPHIKTHKVPAIAHKQLAAGAIGITCQKLGEAEVFAAAGIKDILIAYNIVGRQKLDRLLRLTYQATITVAVDSEEVAHGISGYAQEEGGTVRVVVEVDSGNHRAGVWSAEEAVALARKIATMPHLQFYGLMAYPSAERLREVFARAREQLERDGIPVGVISGGGTGLHPMARELGLTEHRSGTYVFNDMNQVRAGNATLEQCAETVLVTVVTVTSLGHATMDGGSKTFTSDDLRPGVPIGYIKEYPDIFLERLNEEHGILNLTKSSHRLKVGDQLTIIPNHACGITNLHDYMVGARKGRVEVIWPILARGKIR